MIPYLKRAWAEISLPILKENISEIRAILGKDTDIMAVVKADAYGHGEEEMCHCLEECGIKYFAVSNLDEALNVRRYCKNSEILILGYTPPEYANEIAKNNIIQGVISTEYAEALCKNTDLMIRCHIKIDTGMGRLGLKNDDINESINEIKSLCNFKKLSVEGIYTHFAVADSENPNDIDYTNNQEKTIIGIYDALKLDGINIPHLHFMNSAATCYRTNNRSTLARVGIVMYGLHPNYPLEIPSKLRPVMTLKAVVSHVKTIKPGESVSYGRTFVSEDNMKIATVTIGYADGYSRLLSSKGYVLVNGKKSPIIGRICMDQLMIDVTGIDVKSGDIVILIGSDGDNTITADELAELYGTIGYEVVCGISKRVPRIYIS